MFLVHEIKTKWQDEGTSVSRQLEGPGFWGGGDVTGPASATTPLLFFLLYISWGKILQIKFVIFFVGILVIVRQSPRGVY